jgi:hypothetical protein
MCRGSASVVGVCGVGVHDEIGFLERPGSREF